jgi:hypothetical protein
MITLRSEIDKEEKSEKRQNGSADSRASDLCKKDLSFDLPGRWNKMSGISGKNENDLKNELYMHVTAWALIGAAGGFLAYLLLGAAGLLLPAAACIFTGAGYVGFTAFVIESVRLFRRLP